VVGAPVAVVDGKIVKRDDGAGARSRPRAHEDRPTLGPRER
jgi:hypothetical protein